MDAGSFAKAASTAAWFSFVPEIVRVLFAPWKRMKGHILVQCFIIKVKASARRSHAVAPELQQQAVAVAVAMGVQAMGLAGELLVSCLLQYL